MTPDLLPVTPVGRPEVLWHFSEDAGITRFEPRLMPARPEVTEPLVWAVDADYAFTYCFPRDCPRILLWPLPDTTQADLDRWFGTTEARALAHIEYAWLDRFQAASLARYQLPPDTFEWTGPEGGPGNYVNREAVVPIQLEMVDDLAEALHEAGVELRVLDRLTPLAAAWGQSFHFSGYRLRNAQGWVAPAGSSASPAPLPRTMPEPS